MLDHVSLGVANLERSRQFYDAVLRPLGIVRTVDFGDGRGSNYGGMAGQLGVEFTIMLESGVAPSLGMHLCFRAPDRAAVQAFHAAALATGGRDGGTPGLRDLYHPDYFAAYVLDPDGHRIEVVCHAPELPLDHLTVNRATAASTDNERATMKVAPCTRSVDIRFFCRPSGGKAPLVEPEFWREIALVTVHSWPHSPAPIGALIRGHANSVDGPTRACNQSRARPGGAHPNPAPAVELEPAPGRSSSEKASDLVRLYSGGASIL